MTAPKVEREVKVSGTTRGTDGRFTLDQLAAAVDALRAQGVPATEARIYLGHNSGGDWSITAKWDADLEPAAPVTESRVCWSCSRPIRPMGAAWTNGKAELDNDHTPRVGRPVRDTPQA